MKIENIRSARLVECCDSDITYGTVYWDADSGLRPDVLQAEINDIKEILNSDGLNEWCIDDVVEILSERWGVLYSADDDDVCI